MSSIRYFWRVPVPVHPGINTSQVFIWATGYYPPSYGDGKLGRISYLSQPMQSQCFERATKKLPIELPSHIEHAKRIKIATLEFLCYKNLRPHNNYC